MTSQTSLNLEPDAALLRGIEMADAALIARLVRIVNEMREPCRYSNQDFDRRQHAYSIIKELREVGNTPLRRAA